MHGKRSALCGPRAKRPHVLAIHVTVDPFDQKLFAHLVYARDVVRAAGVAVNKTGHGLPSQRLDSRGTRHSDHVNMVGRGSAMTSTRAGWALLIQGNYGQWGH